MTPCGRGIYGKINKSKEEIVSHIIFKSRPILTGKYLICFIIKALLIKVTVPHIFWGKLKNEKCD